MARKARAEKHYHIIPIHKCLKCTTMAKSHNYCISLHKKMPLMFVQHPQKCTTRISEVPSELDDKYILFVDVHYVLVLIFEFYPIFCCFSIITILE